MNSDLRISTNMINHAKVKKLIKRHGFEAFYSLVSFWSYVAINKPDGDITGLDADDIEIASNWNGRDGVFYDALCLLGFLDCEENTIFIHNWVKHNPYAVGAKERSIEAKKKQFCRWGCKKLPKKQHDDFKDWLYNVAKIDTNSNTDSILMVYKRYTSGNTPLPLPEPYPLPEPEPEPEENYIVFEEFYKHYPKKVGKAAAEKAWIKLKVEGDLFKIILSSLEKQKQSDDWKKDNGQFIPYPATWLNGKRWEDEDCVTQSKTCDTCDYKSRGACNKKEVCSSWRQII